jgi:hypothetical protein
MNTAVGAARRRAVLGLLCWTLAGCASEAVHLGPKPPPTYRSLGWSEGGACGLLLFDVIPIGVNGRTQAAYDEALRRSPGGTMLVDTAVNERWYFIPYVGEILCSDVVGTAIR